LTKPLHSFCYNLTCYDCNPECSECIGPTSDNCLSCY